ncbi:uncharacterized protein MKK02DRAFT_39222 [Dioszegia hungarica]|uniref:Diphthamide biosynthesis protein 4 n=1 Tax=Dioszegia hungarica TaxID=4972 RepID=A0AA38H301_9TREE|nr:uncharacterized protein MKK02DRAFT_39222 [Dioszegia hungarica]KAI9633243.1 hypothetical protein MKK02DRAFT_39222 [Dioszegia hungarica]
MMLGRLGIVDPTIPPPPDYLAVLGLAPNASTKEITSAWRRAVLAHHPDKRDNPTGQSTSGVYTGEARDGEVDIRLINEARWVLCEPARRRAWEEQRENNISAGPSRPAEKVGPHIYREVSLELFTPVYPAGPSRQDPGPTVESAAGTKGVSGTATDEGPEEGEAEPLSYTYPCRCSHFFRITHEELEAGIDVVGCDGCGEFLRVGYEVLEDG